MDAIKLEAKMRGEKSANAWRKEGFVPAVVYGKKVPATSLAVDAKVFRKTFQEAGETTVLEISANGNAYSALVRDIEFHPLTGEMMHVDFYAIVMDEEVEAMVEIEYVGESPAVKNDGGILVKSLDEVSVRALPGDLPHSLTVDVSSLATFEDVIHIKDLAVSDKVEVLADPETIVASVARPREEEEEVPTEAPDVSKVEVEEKGKKEEDASEESEEKK